MNAKDKRKAEYAAELESQFIMRLPEEPAKELRELLKSGENIKNRLTIKIDNDMRHGEVRFDHWLMHAKIVDLPTISESLKTIDNKSFYKTADICQMMICKEEPEQTASEEESPTKNKKKDPSKVDKKFLYPHGITPPTKNVRKRRFRKTLKKKYVEAPEIEKEVKRLLRADNEAESSTYEIIREDDEMLNLEQIPSTSTATPGDSAATSSTSTSAVATSAATTSAAASSAASTSAASTSAASTSATTSRKSQKKQKAERGSKKASVASAKTSDQKQSNVVDIFGGAVSDSDIEDHHDHNVKSTNITLGLQECHLSASGSKVVQPGKIQKKNPVEVGKQKTRANKGKSKKSNKSSTVTPAPSTSTATKSTDLVSEKDTEYQAKESPKDDMSLRIEQVRIELEELKQRRQRTKNEIAGMENLALRQRFQDILHTLNQDVMFKEMEYQGLITLQNSEDI